MQPYWINKMWVCFHCSWWNIWKSLPARSPLLCCLSSVRLNMGVVYPRPDPIHLYSHLHGQDHCMRFFPAEFQSLVCMSINPNIVTWFKVMRIKGSCRLINLEAGWSYFWNLWRTFKDSKNMCWSYSARISVWKLSSMGESLPYRISKWDENT